MVKKRIFIGASLLLLATPYCHARGYTLDDANHIIVILIVLVLALIGCGAYSLYYNRKICQRNEQLRRILTALDDYRAMVADDVFRWTIRKPICSISWRNLRVPRWRKETLSRTSL